MAVSVTPLVILGVLLLLIACFQHRKRHVSSDSRLYPPIVSISSRDMFNNPRHAYESALTDYGPVVGVWRKGRLEYIVDNNLAMAVLTNDEAFSFQEGTATILNIHYMYQIFSGFWSDMDDLVKKGISFQLETIVDKVTPIFLQRMEDRIQAMSSRTSGSDSGMNIFDHAHATICEAMLLVVLGQRFMDQKFLKVAEQVAIDIAVVTGMYQNTSWWARTFPLFWRVATWSGRSLLLVWLTECIFRSRVLFSLAFQFLPVVGPVIWGVMEAEFSVKNLDDFEDDEASLKAGEVTVLQYLARRWRPCVSRLRKVQCFLWIFCLILGILFASVHQTSSVVAWVVCELATRPEYLSDLREELTSLAPTNPETDFPQITHTALKSATSLDSFIREVLRTKGDTLSTCRLTTRDVKIGGNVIPKGFLVIPMASLSHFNTEYHGPDADVFDGNRWTRRSESKPAIMGSPSYFPFGLGKWACPGRFLAINEIKLVVWSIIGRWTPHLKDGTYRITDPLNITSVPPEAELNFVKRSA
ncbi:cytochrome P450 [Mycena capillaripes]|nr:cytochrome P450 [Mycena capillaripes]